MATKKVGLVGVLPQLKAEDASRLAVYVVRGSEILAQGNVCARGEFRVDVSRAAIQSDSRYGLEAVIGPAGMPEQLSQIPRLRAWTSTGGNRP